MYTIYTIYIYINIYICIYVEIYEYMCIYMIYGCIKAHDWGHDLCYVIANGNRTIFDCKKCGAYAETKAETKGKIGLTKPCVPPTKSSERSLARINARKHPTSDASLSRSYGLCWMPTGGSGQATCPLPPIASWRSIEEPPASSIGNQDIDSD